MLLVHTVPVTPLFYDTSLWYFNHLKLGGGDVGAEYCHHSPNKVLCLFQRVITGIVRRTFRRYISTSGSPELAIYRLSSRRLLATRTRVGQALLSHSFLDSSLKVISSIIRTSRPIIPSPDCPSVEIGLSWSPCGFRGSHLPVYFHKSPGLPFIHSRVITTRASPARLPLVAVLDRSKGVVSSNGVDCS